MFSTEKGRAVPETRIASVRGVPVTRVTPGVLFLPLRSHPSTMERSSFARARASEIRGYPFAKFRADPSSDLLIPFNCRRFFLPFRFGDNLGRFNTTCVRKFVCRYCLYIVLTEYSRNSDSRVRVSFSS